ncbi:MAG: PorV/PorQ family protein [Elusimicrobia bacterium]|nr:PorV/PorQ family protein [Elusimicrobiota bacterium]
MTGGRGARGRGRSKRPFPLIGLLLIAVFVSPCLPAEDNAGVTAAPILQIPLGARAAGLGGAFTAVADDVSTLHYNPAGLANLHHREASFMHLTGQEDQAIQYLAGESPLPFTGLSGSGYATLGGSLLFSGSGALELNTTNPDGSLKESRTVDAGGDFVATVGYAERVADTPFEVPDSSDHIEHFVGVSGKYVRSTLAETYSARAYAADLGYFARAPGLGVSLGASVLNLGGRMRYLERGDPLPVTLRAGGAWSVPMPERHGLVWGSDFEYQYYERLWFVNTGVEYSLFKQWAARAGYQFHRRLGGLTFGFGGQWKGWGIDYAWGYSPDLGDSHRFSFTFRFGKVPVREREKPRRPFIESVPDREELPERGEERPQTYDRKERPRRRSPDPKSAPGWIY